MGVAPPIEVSSEQYETILTLLRKYLPETTAWVYGSRAKRISRPHSDLDLVVFAEPGQHLEVGELREAFEESNLPFRVDLFVWDDVPDSFRKNIREQHIELTLGQGRAYNAITAAWPPVTAGDTSEKISGWLYRPSFPAHWQRQPLYSMATWVNGLAFRKIQFSDTGLPVIKIAEIKRGISGQTKFTEQAFDESVLVKSGDLLFSWSGQPETSIDAFWWKGPEGWLNQHIFRVIPIAGIDQDFFYCLLRYLKPNFIGIARNKQTTGLGHVTKRDLENLEAAYPALPEQRAIAHILGTLDDKIELNQKTNQTLEEIVKAIFKSWFVDFGPVRAKIEGRPTGLPSEISDLFPDKLVDSEIGKIPNGWEVSKLGSVISLEYGKALKAADRMPGDVPVYGSNGQVGWHENSLVNGPGIIVGRKGNPGTITWAHSNFFPIDTTFYAVCKTDIPMSFVYRVLEYMSLGRLSADSAVPGLNRNAAYMEDQTIPNSALVKVFSKFSNTLLERQNFIEQENRCLEQVRDTLLPKLISGEFRIPDAEKFLEEADI